MSPTEEKVAAIYANVIGVTAVAEHDNFFDLGGDSQQAVVIALELEMEFGTEFPVDLVGELAEVGKVAEWIDAKRT